MRKSLPIAKTTNLIVGEDEQSLVKESRKSSVIRCDSLVLEEAIHIQLLEVRETQQSCKSMQKQQQEQTQKKKKKNTSSSSGVDNSRTSRAKMTTRIR
jgi:hypothetical protein